MHPGFDLSMVESATRSKRGRRAGEQIAPACLEALFDDELGPWAGEIAKETLASHAGLTRSDEAPNGTLMTGLEPQRHAMRIEGRPVVLRSMVERSHSLRQRRRQQLCWRTSQTTTTRI